MAKRTTKKAKRTGLARLPKRLPAKKLDSKVLLHDIRQLVEESKRAVATSVNSELVRLYWRVGQRIHRDILDSKRADYSHQIVQTLSAQLVPHLGRGFGKRNLIQMIRFAQVFPDEAVVVHLSTNLGWSHFVEIIRPEEPLARDFYAEMCRLERWTVRTLRARMQGMLFERTALAKKPREVIEAEFARLRTDDQLTPDLIFRDPYLLDFLGLTGAYSEVDLESAILRELEKFILELGTGFAFVARQYRMTIDGRDHHLDLLFYHRGLRRLLALDLKLGEFDAAHKGEMELYLRWLARHEQAPGEGAPLGLILCASSGAEQIELLDLQDGDVRVANYLTELPSRPLLAHKLHEAVCIARERLAKIGQRNQG